MSNSTPFPTKLKRIIAQVVEVIRTIKGDHYVEVTFLLSCYVAMTLSSLFRQNQKKYTPSKTANLKDL